MIVSKCCTHPVDQNGENHDDKAGNQAVAEISLAHGQQDRPADVINRFTCAGGTASVDLGLHILRGVCGDSLANAAARYIFHPGARRPGNPQNPPGVAPLGHATPESVRRIIAEMEGNLEEPLTIPELCDEARILQRQINRLFIRYVGKTPQLYYRDVRLDRARGLVTQTELPMSEIAVASGFASQAHFSKAYHERFGIQPRVDRVKGRIPFEFRAWLMHRKLGG